MKYRKSFITFGVVLLSMAGSAIPAHAEDIVISVTDNGSSSSNEVHVNVQNNTTVEQNNTSNIENNVTNNVDTGNNTANGNSGGDTSITTGEATSTTTISNENINNNVAQAGSGGTVGGSVTINGNGSKTSNAITAQSNNSTSVTQNNTAVITNNSTTNANTGNNTANWNNGDVTIKTGSIKAETTIENKNVNTSIAKILGDCNSECVVTNEMILKIFGNGTGSINNLLFTNNDNKTYSSNNLATITNNVVHNLNTGGNTANGNNGDVLIVTGDVESTITITNQANSNYVEIECGCKQKPQDPEEPTTPPTKPTPNGGNGGVGGTSNGTSGDVLGAAIGEILPATGNLFLLWATVASLILFFSGWYLRFRSGCAPGFTK